MSSLLMLFFWLEGQQFTIIAWSFRMRADVFRASWTSVSADVPSDIPVVRARIFPVRGPPELWVPDQLVTRLKSLANTIRMSFAGPKPTSPGGLSLSLVPTVGGGYLTETSSYMYTLGKLCADGVTSGDLRVSHREVK